MRAGLTFFLILSSCVTPIRRDLQSVTSSPLQMPYTTAEIELACQEAIAKFSTRINNLALSSPERWTLPNSFREYDEAFADLSTSISPISLLSKISPDKEIRRASDRCRVSAQNASIDASSRKDIYTKLLAAEASLRKGSLSNFDSRLIQQTMIELRHNGLDLPDDQLAQFKELTKQIVNLKIEFSANLSNNKDELEFTEQEMQGLPESTKALFPKKENGNYKAAVKQAYLIPFMQNATDSRARKKYLRAWENREAEKNMALLTESIELRSKAAALTGYQDWADYRTANYMSKNGETAWNFLLSLKNKLHKAYKIEFEKMLRFKKELDPNATGIDAWDTLYLTNQYRKKYLAVDDELVRTYLPAEHVLREVFKIYERLLGVQFVEIENPSKWHPSVKLFEIHDPRSKKLIAHFYVDLFTRDGKSPGAFASTLRSSQILLSGQWQTPVAALVTNFTPASVSRPSLLSIEEVKTLFHEFGHVMHMCLSTVPYSSIGSTTVNWDFVEAPSQMLENWAWAPQVLKRISQKFDEPEKSMPDDLIKNLGATQKFNLAWTSNRQLVLGLFDLTLHRKGYSEDPVKTYRNIFKNLMDYPPVEDAKFPATFTHIMGGYDAGYYSYLWANVYALDMFTHFSGDKLLSSEVGARYRRTILEKGNSDDAEALVTQFLGRKPNSKAFFEFLGLK